MLGPWLPRAMPPPGWYIGVSSVGCQWSEQQSAGSELFLSELLEGEPLGPSLMMGTRAAVLPAPSKGCPLWPLRDVRLGLHRAVWLARTSPDRQVVCLWRTLSRPSSILTAIVMVG